MGFSLTVLAAIAVLGPLIALHEWGHYIVARLCGVKVLTYSIGFGPKIAGWTSKRSGIDYRLSLLPLGGYVKILDEREGEVPEAEKHLAFNAQHPLKKIAIVAAGPIMNFLIAIGLFWVLFLTPSEQLATRIGSVLPDTPAAAVAMSAGDKIVEVDGQAVQTWEEINYRLANRMGEAGTISVGVQPYSVNNSGSLNEKAANAVKTYNLPVSDFMQGADKGKDAISSLGAIPWQPEIAPIIGDLSPDGAASRQGMLIGDRITAINGQAIDDWVSATRIIKDSPEVVLNISVLREGKPLTLEIMPQGKKDTMGNQYGQIGAMVVAPEITVPDAYKTTVEYSPAIALMKSFQKTEQLAVMTVASMGKMITGKIGIDNLSGPITIAKVAKQSFDISWEMVLSTAALISLSLAVLNLLPIPVLDGGHILYYAIELIRGKPISEQMQIVGMNIGLILMAGFMILAIGNDISRLF